MAHQDHLPADPDAGSILPASEAQQALARSLACVERAKKEWESTADSLPQLVCLLDREGKVIRANLTVESWCLGKVARVRGRDFHGLLHPGCTDSECYLVREWRGAQARLAAGNPVRFEAYDPRRDRFFMMQFRPVRTHAATPNEGAASFAAAVVEDITERKRMELELPAAQEQEVEIGGRIQQSLLAGAPPRDIPGMRVAAMSLASRKIDGDFYAFFQPGSGTLDLIVGDVMGKGVPAALIGAATKNHFLSAASRLIASSRSGRLPEPEEVVAAVHSEMAAQLIELESFVTLCYARIDRCGRSVTIVDCGHPSTPLFERRFGRCRVLAGDAMPLGFSREATYQQFAVPIEPGDRLLFYSDGVIEAHKKKGDLFGMERLKEIVALNAEIGPDELIEKIRAAVIAFAASAEFSDDLTCIAVDVDCEDAGDRTAAEISVTSGLGELAKIRDFIRGFCLRAAPAAVNDDLRYQLELAVHEAAVNIVNHAYEGRPGQPIAVAAEYRKGAVTITLTHWGKSFDPKCASPPAFDGSRSSGFGLFILDKWLDEIRYTFADDGKNTVRMVKTLTEP